MVTTSHKETVLIKQKGATKMNKLTDLTLGIKKCAFIVAQILEDREPDFLPCHSFAGVDFQTRTLYNGRENGLVFSMKLYKEKAITDTVINVYVYEHRIADDICVTIWEDSLIRDTYTVKNIKDGDKRYKDSTYINKSFNYNEYYQCADYVYETFENFYNEICGKKKEPIRLKNKSGMGKISHFGLEGI